MADAVVKGEVHLSRKDKRALEQYDLSRFDAVFREGYDKDYFQRDLNTLYALFAIGHLVYGATYGRLYFSTEEFRANADEEDVPFYDEIDADIHETYEMVPRWKRAGLSLLSPIWAAFFLGLISLPFRWVVNWLPAGWSPILGVAGVVAVIVFFGFFCALGYFIMIEEEVMYDRDEEMADEILRITEDEGYDSILVSCGGNHRPGIADYLEEDGWKVKQEASDSPIGKLLIWKDRLFKAVLNPVKTLKKISSKLR